MAVNLSCIPGGHSGPVIGQDPTNSLRMSIGWRLVPARYDEKTNTWIYDPESGAQVCVCPLHTVQGEPSPPHN